MGKPGFPIPLRKGCALTFAQAGGWGKPGFPMFTSAVHAAAPHTNRMNIGSSWEGAALPNPPAGGAGETRFPHPPA